MNCGWRRAVSATREYVGYGTTAQRDWGSEAWRRRHIYSISLGGSCKVLGISMYDERVLTPGGLEGLGSDEVFTV